MSDGLIGLVIGFLFGYIAGGTLTALYIAAEQAREEDDRR